MAKSRQVQGRRQQTVTGKYYEEESGMSGTSSEETGNLEVVRRAFEAFQDGNAEALMKAFAPNAHYHFAPVGKFTGDYRGAPAIMEFFGQVASESEGTFRVTQVEMAASGNRVFALWRTNGKRGGKTLDNSNVGVFTLAGGVVTEVMECESDYPANAAFWS
jgi:uncharacterized protein